MTATIHRLHNTNPIAGFLRVGHGDHKWLEDQQARGALSYRRFVFEAAHIRQQRPLVNLLRKAHFEIVLDTNFAELSSVGKFQGAARELPWARKDRPWAADDVAGNQADFVASQIAEFAIEENVDVILNPNGLVEASSNWLTASVRMNEALYRVFSRSFSFWRRSVCIGLSAYRDHGATAGGEFPGRRESCAQRYCSGEYLASNFWT